MQGEGRLGSHRLSAEEASIDGGATMPLPADGVSGEHRQGNHRSAPGRAVAVLCSSDKERHDTEIRLFTCKKKHR